VSYGSDTLATLEALARAHGPLIVAITVFLVAWFTIMGVTGWLAGRRNREGGIWSVAALFLGPLALIALLLLPKPAKGPALSPLWAQLEREEADRLTDAPGAAPEARPAG
jgi:hypothetical protein